MHFIFGIAGGEKIKNTDKGYHHIIPSRELKINIYYELYNKNKMIVMIIK
jgi:hypothetical protein